MLLRSDHELTASVTDAEWPRGDDSPLCSSERDGRLASKSLPEQIQQWLSERLDRAGTPPGPATDRIDLADDGDASIRRLSQQGRYYQKGSEAEERWLAETLGQDEPVLGWLGVHSVIARPSGAVIPPAKAHLRFLLTPRWTMLVALVPKKRKKEQGENTWELPAERLRITERVGRDRVSVGGWTFRTWLNNHGFFRELAEVVALAPAKRRREVARLNWLHAGRGREQLELAKEMLRAAERWGGPPEWLSEAYVEAAGQEPAPAELFGAGAAERVTAAVGALVSEPDADRLLLAWARSWELDPATELRLVQVVLDLEEADEDLRVAVALPLHRVARDRAAIDKKDLVEQAMLDISFAAHLVRAGERDEARAILKQRQANLPDERLSDLLPPTDVDLTAEGGQVVRIRLLELLAEARGEPGEADLGAIAELARLQPLVREPVAELAQRAAEPLSTRAQQVLSLLEPAGLQRIEARPTPSPVEREPLPAELIEGRLPHPTARSLGTADWLRTKLGKVKAPDHGALRSYAERVTDKNHPRVMDALTDAALVLGVSSVEAYVSRGDHSAGIRAYEGSPPFLVIGGAHLDEGSDLYMSQPALLFLIGAEVAHLRFGHTRLSSSEVWEGIWSKSSQLLEVLGVFAGPLVVLGSAMASLRRLNLAQRLLRGAGVVSTGAGGVLGMIGVARDIQSTSERADNAAAVAVQTEVGTRESELLAACRLLQLTADRAGLLLCGHLGAAVEGVFLSSAEYRVELPLARRHGLVKTLSRRDAHGEMMNQTLALRLAALFSFFLSSDYDELLGATDADE